MVPEFEQTEIVYGKRNQNPIKIKTVTVDKLLVSLNSTQISYYYVHYYILMGANLFYITVTLLTTVEKSDICLQTQSVI